MIVGLSIIIFSFLLAASGSYYVGFYLPRSGLGIPKSLQKSLLVNLVGSTFIFVGFMWLELILLDIVLGFIGHGFSEDVTPSLLMILALVALGLGTSWMVKLAVAASPFACLLFPYLFIQGLDQGLAEIAAIDGILLALILSFNLYYFVYVFRRL